MLNGSGGRAAGGRLLNVDEVAEMLDIDRSTVYRHRRAGRLPLPIKIGKRVLWIGDEVKRWLEAGAPNLRRWGQMSQSKPWHGKMTI
ncbi:helix-turn-helix domain-containing protein [Planctomycetota bacterium]|nr:helix-turn-helix domain-containing protein [Planctomycetota bacterium]